MSRQLWLFSEHSNLQRHCWNSYAASSTRICLPELPLAGMTLRTAMPRLYTLPLKDQSRCVILSLFCDNVLIENTAASKHENSSTLTTALLEHCTPLHPRGFLPVVKFFLAGYWPNFVRTNSYLVSYLFTAQGLISTPLLELTVGL